MKPIKHLLIAASAAIVTAGSGHAAFVVNDADIILGIKATGGTGSNINLFFNVGSSTNLRDGGGQGLIGNINSDLVAAYGATWSTRSDLFFGVIGSRTNLPGGDPDGAGPLDPNRTVYIGRNVSVAGSSVPYFENISSNGASSYATPYSGYRDFVQGLAETALGQGVASLDLNTFPTQSFTDSTTTGSSQDRSFGGVFLNAQFLSNLGNNTTNFSDIQRIQPGTAPAPGTSIVGTVVFDQLGNVSVIPEPSSILLVGAAGAASLFRRRRQAA